MKNFRILICLIPFGILCHSAPQKPPVFDVEKWCDGKNDCQYNEKCVNFLANWRCVPGKSLYRSCERSHFHGTEYEIWANFGPVGNTEKKLGPIISNF